MSVAAEVVENFVGDRERFLGIDNPILGRERTNELVEGFRLGQRSTTPNELKLFFGASPLE